MTEPRRVLLLVGSAKKPRSNSASLGGYLVERLEERGWQAATIFAHRALRTEQGLAGLLEAVDACTLMVVAFPLYVDSLPAQLTRVLEEIASRRGGDRAGGASPALVAIVNNGFPEASQNEVALRICRRFAGEAGLRWVGGLALGGGEALGGRPLAEVGGMARHAVAALELAAEALDAGEPVPESAVRRMARPMI